MPDRIAPSTRPRLLPIRACCRCDEVFDVFHLTMVGTRWMCRDCHRRLEFAPRPADAAAAEAMSLTARPTESLDVSALRALDRATRYGPIALRVVGYTLLLHASPEQSMLSALIAGVFLGDTIAWLPRAWFDVRFHGLAVAIEAVVYSVLFFSMQASGALALPVDIGARYLTGGAAALVVGLQGASFSWKLSR